MAKKSKTPAEKTGEQLRASGDEFATAPKSVDPALAALFQSTLVGINTSNISQSHARYRSSGSREFPSHNKPIAIATRSEVLGSDPDSENEAAGGKHQSILSSVTRQFEHERAQNETTRISSPFTRKRKRRNSEDEVEDSYMKRLLAEEARDELKRQQEKIINRMRIDVEPHLMEHGSQSENDYVSGSEIEEATVQHDYTSSVPQHETLSSSKEVIDMEKASRTVFLANVSTQAIKSKTSRKALLAHLVSFVPSLPVHKLPHKVNSIRFRSTAFSTSSVPKKAAFVKKELMDATTKSTNAYVVYSTAVAAREAVKKLNGSVVLDRHLRVDGVAHPAQTDHRRCVFVGNLGFVDDESMIKAAEDEDSNRKPRKAKEPADTEEGLWRQFSNAGVVESVRIIRDKTTRVGKGIAYVQFQNSNAVEKALFYNEKKFPPMLPRPLRVTRAKNIRKTASYAESNRIIKKSSQIGRDEQFKPKPSSKSQSMAGRVRKLLGRAGAAQSRNADDRKIERVGVKKNMIGVSKTPEAIVFEGYRASNRAGKGSSKVGSSKKHGKPLSRSSKRGAAFKASGGKKRHS